MSGIDEQTVPQCPKCNKSHEIYIGGGTFMFPENARVRRGLKYMLFSSRRIIEKKPEFHKDEITCVGCSTNYDNNTEYYNRLKNLFDTCMVKDEYYTDADFYEDDRADVWDADGNFKMEGN